MTLLFDADGKETLQRRVGGSWWMRTPILLTDVFHSGSQEPLGYMGMRCYRRGENRFQWCYT